VPDVIGSSAASSAANVVGVILLAFGWSALSHSSLLLLT
jgi:hypothetical protein